MRLIICSRAINVKRQQMLRNIYSLLYMTSSAKYREQLLFTNESEDESHF